MSKLSRVIVSLVLICALTLCGCSSILPAEMEDQVLTFDDLTISMPVYFEDLTQFDDSIPTTGFFVYGYSEIVLTGLRDDKSLFEEVPTLEEYGKTLIANSNVNSQIEIIDGLTTFTYYQLNNNQSHTCFVALFEGTDAFWMITGSCQTMNFKYAQEKFIEIFKSIQVA